MLDGDALGEGKAFFQFGGVRASPDHTRLAWCADEKGSELFTMRVRDLPPAPICRRGDRDIGLRGLERRRRRVLLRAARRQSSPAPRDAAIGSARRRTAMRSCTKSRIRAGSSASAARNRAASASSICTIMSSGEERLIDLARHRRAAAPRRRAQARPALRFGTLRRHADHPHQCGRRRGFQARRRPISRRRVQWRDFIPHRRGRMIMSHVPVAHHLIRLEREERLAAHLDSRHARRQRARDRASTRRGLFARPRKTCSSSTRRRCAFPIRR